MRVLVVTSLDCASESSFRDQIRLVFSPIYAVRYSSVSLAFRDIRNLSDFVFDPAIGCDKIDAMQTFASIDCVIMSGDSKLLPWLPETQPVYSLLKQCVKRNVPCLSYGFGALLVPFMLATEGEDLFGKIISIGSVSSSCSLRTDESKVLLEERSGKLFKRGGANLEARGYGSVGIFNHRWDSSERNRSRIFRRADVTGRAQSAISHDSTLPLEAVLSIESKHDILLKLPNSFSVPFSSRTWSILRPERVVEQLMDSPLRACPLTHRPLVADVKVLLRTSTARPQMIQFGGLFSCAFLPHEKFPVTLQIIENFAELVGASISLGKSLFPKVPVKLVLARDPRAYEPVSAVYLEIQRLVKSRADHDKIQSAEFEARVRKGGKFIVDRKKERRRGVIAGNWGPVDSTEALKQDFSPPRVELLENDYYAEGVVDRCNLEDVAGARRRLEQGVRIGSASSVSCAQEEEPDQRDSSCKTVKPKTVSRTLVPQSRKTTLFAERRAQTDRIRKTALPTPLALI